ncbi:hypothetical protein ACHAWO_013052 [Cyclotella atomus]|uniref:Uncharacterized protein n=1 Tax=Cyclotella atomus TaxID=382360 RepID=A0ABD3NRZ5_9STRA
MIQDILLKFKLHGLPPIGEDGSSGRLLYEIMKCFGKNPLQSTSGAVTQLHPFAKEQKYHCIRDAPKIRATNCTVYLCGDEFDRPVRNGEPYALVVGNATAWKGVDRAVAIVKMRFIGIERIVDVSLLNE